MPLWGWILLALYTAALTLFVLAWKRMWDAFWPRESIVSIYGEQVSPELIAVLRGTRQ